MKNMKKWSQCFVNLPRLKYEKLSAISVCPDGVQLWIKNGFAGRMKRWYLLETYPSIGLDLIAGLNELALAGFRYIGMK